MINLLPPEGHRVVKREYILRVGATLAFLFGGIIFALTVALLPTYILVSAQIQGLSLEMEKEDTDGETFTRIAGEIERTNLVLAQLKSLPATVSVSEVIAEIENRAPTSITFKTFFAVTENGVLEKIQVQGVATTREALSAFKESLEDSPLFGEAQVPIADLARDTNLPFAITITIQENS